MRIEIAVLVLAAFLCGCSTVGVVDKPLNDAVYVIDGTFPDDGVAPVYVGFRGATYGSMVPGRLFDDVKKTVSKDRVLYQINHHCEMCGAEVVRARTVIELSSIDAANTQCKVSSEDYGFIFSSRRKDREQTIIDYLQRIIVPNKRMSSDAVNETIFEEKDSNPVGTYKLIRIEKQSHKPSVRIAMWLVQIEKLGLSRLIISAKPGRYAENCTIMPCGEVEGIITGVWVPCEPGERLARIYQFHTDQPTDLNKLDESGPQLHQIIITEPRAHCDCVWLLSKEGQEFILKALNEDLCVYLEKEETE